MLSSVDYDVGLPLMHDLSHERDLDSIKGPQEPKSKVVDAYPDRGSLFDPDPGMSIVEIVTLGNRDPLHLHYIHRPHYCMDGVFVVKVLIEFAPAAIVVMGAQLE
jgi:hypothetical protein